MPLLDRWNDGNALIGIWHTTETEDELRACLCAAWTDEALQCYSSPVRRKEYLSVRVLMKELLGEEIQIGHHSSGKPYVMNGKYSVSISHTKGYAAVLLAPQSCNPGIDIEHCSDRVKKVASRFMRTDEYCDISPEKETGWLLLHWSAKETLFKRLDRKEIDFKEHLQILPFRMAARGEMSAREYKTDERHCFKIKYLLTENFVLTWSV